MKKQSTKKIIYFCPMHKKVFRGKKGSCPKCGMELTKGLLDKNGKLIAESSNRTENYSHKDHDHDNHEAHDSHQHGTGHGGPEMAAEFLRRFYIVTVLLIPLVLFSEMVGVRILGIPDFPFRQHVEFGIATIIFYYSLIFFKHAKHEIKSRQYGMMTLVSLAVGAGYVFSAVSTFIPSITTEFYLEITTLIWILLFGHFLEAKSSTAAGDALREVAKLLPGEAHLIQVKGKGQEVIDIPVDQLKSGDVVMVKPGEKVPADGIIIEGSSYFNESHLTGESRPVEKGKGERVIAGAIVEDGSVKIKLDRVGESSTIGQIQNLVKEAQQTKPSAQRLADKAAKWLTFAALSVAMITLLVWTLVIGEAFVFAITLAITVLVIACPHALGLAIPAVSTIATRLAVNNGLFIKDMGKLEIVKDADYVVFDKTGTLRKGEFGGTDVILIQDSKLKIQSKNSKQKIEKNILEIAASLEVYSSHVIGMAIVEKAKRQKLKFRRVTNFKNYAGKGISGKIGKTKYFIGNKVLVMENSQLSDEAEKIHQQLSKEGKTVIFLANEKSVIGIIALADQIKTESNQAINQLHELGVKVAMLTGDNHQSANAVAKKLKIDTVFAEVLPEYKYEYVRKLQKKGHKVVMAGDGVNDAPALTQADVGVAIGAGTDVAVEAGDIVLTQSNPQHIVRLVVLSRKVYNKMTQNLFWALGYNIVAIPAAAGLFIPYGIRLAPGVGAILMSLSSVIVVINAMSLRNTKLNSII